MTHLVRCAQISKWAGGIGLSIHNIRARGSKSHTEQTESRLVLYQCSKFTMTLQGMWIGGEA
jgi:hypothetical protein